MSTQLCLAQAQKFVFFLAELQQKEDRSFLSGICAQVSLFYQKAFEACQQSAALRKNSNFAN